MEHTYRIVVGVDGSPGGRLALHWALREAARRGGTVQAVIAWQWDGPEASGVTDINPKAAKDRAVQTLYRELDAAVAGFVTPPTVATEVVRGSPSLVLTRAAVDADVLVLGSHGHGRLHHAVLGSVSEDCIRRACCPVVVVPLPTRDKRGDADRPATTLVATH
ncbi:MAG TPA: universal stress protein [Micromonosporaceae bacterium]|nr:universal stress protein [Micromonosporaceae bacterium]